MYGMFNEQRAENLKTYDPEDMRDYMDCYLREMKRVTEEGKTESSFYGRDGDMNLNASLLDLYLAGSETTSTTLLFSIMYMVNYPNVQKRVQDELDSVVGPSRLPSLNDKDELPYLEATISEIQRCGNIAHMAVEVNTFLCRLSFVQFILTS